MAQAKKAREKTQEKKTNQTQNQEPLQAVNTPPSRRAGNNQPQRSSQTESLQTTRNQPQQRGLSRREQFASPFSFMRLFRDEMDRLFDDFGFGGGLISPSFGRGFLEPSFGRDFESAMWSPQTEVFERGGELVVRADLPGMTKDDIDVDIKDDQIIIRGERRDERETDEQGFYQTERSYGSFYRSIPLPQGIDSEQANATFRDGILEITMPKPEQKSRGRRLEIGEGGATSGQSNKQTGEQTNPSSKSANQ